MSFVVPSIKKTIHGTFAVYTILTLRFKQLD